MKNNLLYKLPALLVENTKELNAERKEWEPEVETKYFVSEVYFTGFPLSMLRLNIPNSKLQPVFNMQFEDDSFMVAGPEVLVYINDWVTECNSIKSKKDDTD